MNMKTLDKSYSVNQIIQFIYNKKEDFWLQQREEKALALFKKVAQRVPAYKDFLKKNKIKLEKVKTWQDFQSVPLVSKKNYLRQYPLKSLCWDGSLKKPLVFTATSGSTGEPFYFPRQEPLDWQYSILVDLFLKNSSFGTTSPTLVIIGFGMGVWIAGLITYKAFEIAALRNNHPISILTPGINKIEILQALKKLVPYFKQTILIGYPPFIKDIIDEALEQGTNLRKVNLRLLFAAEAFTEEFRDYLVEKIGIRNLYLDTLNIYGSADIGVMAYETPISILIRRLAIKNPKLFSEIFSSIQKTPTLAQYNPLFIAFESQKGEILLTGDNAIPLIRYSIGDHGGTLNFSEIVLKLKNYGLDIEEEARKAGINTIYQLPFVFVYERMDFSTNLYGLQIYPETIREVLIQNPLNKTLTGKFTMITKYDKKQNQYVEINLELRKNKKPDTALIKLTLDKIFHVLCVKNSEFRELSNYIKDRELLQLVLWPAEHPLYFKPGIKQKWVTK